MSNERIGEYDPRIRQALVELRAMVREQWPEASFEVSRGEDPEGIYLDATVDTEDTDEVMDVVIDRLLELQVVGRPGHLCHRWSSTRAGACIPAIRTNGEARVGGERSMHQPIGKVAGQYWRLSTFIALMASDHESKRAMPG